MKQNVPTVGIDLAKKIGSVAKFDFWGKIQKSCISNGPDKNQAVIAPYVLSSS
jgi:hypothetical protein